LLLRCGENLTETWTEVLLATLDPRKASNRCLDIIGHYGDVDRKLAQDRAHDTLRLFEHRSQQMFRLNLLILIFLRHLDSGLNGLLGS
jgi:hypothetical protein